MAQKPFNVDQSLAPHDQVLASYFAQLDLENNQARNAGTTPTTTAQIAHDGGLGHARGATRGSRSGDMAGRVLAGSSHEDSFNNGTSHIASVGQLVPIHTEPSIASTTTTRGQCRGFEVMRMVADKQQHIRRAPHEEAILRFARDLYDFSPNYQGDPLNMQNQSAQINNNENTALWLTGLPTNCTYKMLLEAIARCAPIGKVFSTVINAANPAANMPFAAAKVVFFNRVAAANCLRAIVQGRVVVGGRRPSARWNRIKSASQPDTSRSRVILIRGPSSLISRDALESWFSQCFRYQTEDILVHPRQAGVTTLEWRFGSYRAQATSAAQVLSRVKLGNTKLEWRWGLDPCA
ncbi:hypothetical protein CORC01_13713 [Colletotrichum orchidophilum]|uniref:Uncharacterized protein n=1 Tax=Colletotrichum orchidophilum TaxID=1209926 RepID=A0A1G4APG1_9PEZI|nr:uncharacterized protein CORC01_13713 [Colletotrichum orchidophilum]OHE91001.1 hypothetical protein CORC01_13713 [Colletotrichum orchidophilum]